MEILFTRSKSPLSWMIRHLTGEPVSHCAIRVYDRFIIQSNLLGVHAEADDEFTAEIIYRVQRLDNPDALNRALSQTGHWYDFGGLLYLGLRCLLPFLPKKNLWQSTGMFLCTEFVTDVIDGNVDSMITPYQLYERLNK